ncbi:MAG: phosphosulfolactate synthase [Flavobacteriales bacterium]
MFDEYRRMLDKFGLNAAEVSDGSMILPHEEKLKCISTLAKDVTVVSEVGSKEEGILISPGKWINMMRDELDAGSWKVIAEGRESGTVGIFRPNGQPHTILINKIKSKVNNDNIIWEAPQKKQVVWFIKLMGCNVNLGNIAPQDVIPTETLRYGLRGDTFLDFLPEEMKAGKQQTE